jgi:cyclophilin family peptidyl-prolyl cis-trans isomerase
MNQRREKVKRSSSNRVLLAVVIAGVLIGSPASRGQKKPAGEKAASPQTTIATIETSYGSFEIELLADDAPMAVENFVKLAEKKYFDGTRVHRISRERGIIQMGDDKSRDTAKVREWGSGGKSIWGKDFRDELDARSATVREGYRKGIVAMANRGPNTNGSQFFIMLKDEPYMPKNYTIFGKVGKGLDVIDSIGKADIIPQLGPRDGRPKDHIVIKRVTLRKEPVQSPAARK